MIWYFYYFGYKNILIKYSAGDIHRKTCECFHRNRARQLMVSGVTSHDLVINLKMNNLEIHTDV